MNPSQVSLPSAETIRARIDDLDQEAALLRKLLRVVHRIETRKQSATETKSSNWEAAHASA